MKKGNQKGYTLVELLIVVVIMGVIFSIAVSWYFKAMVSAENQSAVALMSIIRQHEVIFYSHNQRFGRLDEIAANTNRFGRVGSDLVLRRGPYKFVLTTSTGTPSASDLRNLSSEYLVTATREHGSNIPYVYTMDQSGVISRILPDPGAIGE